MAWEAGGSRAFQVTKGVTEVARVGIAAGHHEPLAFFNLGAERPAPCGQRRSKSIDL
jgi:hypothetical protein